ncbi:ornithine cyclodeaminase family protein [Flagellimonas algicola]|uniref:Ornithine cyclodeaminase family protein n=1 Tax=Flagellimonas algicola TaxID=2583815 RepID=A0ABY2WH11_9FLAO|nr:ornithine cyclodeaminase family protein [Allomuricauda algicola]TMU50866.1 ornithine cyclodeaminase family protein [Allomuricauda algicola]
MQQPLQISSEFIEKHTDFLELTRALQEGFANKKMLVPKRHHHDFPNPITQKDTTLLLMPAWNPGNEAGVKVVTVNPGNDKFDLPSIQGSYLYLDAKTGVLKAIMDAKNLTAKRTAAASALASSFLSRENTETMLMIGTGALSVNLIRAHAAVRPIKKVFIWGRNQAKAEVLCQELSQDSFEICSVSSVAACIGDVDLVSCATLSETPLVLGEDLVHGQHIDLVGAYKPNMRESDDETIRRTSVFLDTRESGLKESGDIAIPLKHGLLKESDIIADLFDLCSEAVPGRTSENEITLFKSVGHALEDLIAASYYYSKL